MAGLCPALASGRTSGGGFADGEIVAWAVVVGAIALFCIVNTQNVSVDWVFGESDNAPWIVIAISAVAGFVLGYLTSYRRR